MGNIKYWWSIPCSILYANSALFSTFIASTAYDDPSNPNYARYEGWELQNFIIHDIKIFLIWLFLGILLYFVFEGKSAKASLKAGCEVLLISLAFFVVLMIVLSFIMTLIWGT